MCSIDLEPCDLWRETPRIARKPHRCSACGAAIHPGTAYLDHFSLFEGVSSSESACFTCWLAREEFADAHGQRFPPSALADLLADCLDGFRWTRHMKRVAPAMVAEREEAVRWAVSLRALRTRARLAVKE